MWFIDYISMKTYYLNPRPLPDIFFVYAPANITMDYALGADRQDRNGAKHTIHDVAQCCRASEAAELFGESNGNSPGPGPAENVSSKRAISHGVERNKK